MASSKKLKILFVTPEVVPFMKTGGVADVSSALPQKLQEMGHQVRIVVPKYGVIDERKNKIHEVVRLKDLLVKIGDKEVTYSLRSSFLIGPAARVQIYFLDNKYYFGGRHSLYLDPITDEPFPDNDERFILLCQSVFELIQRLGWIPDIIHLNDWQCGLVPVYLKTLYANNPAFSGIKTVFSIHNIAQQGRYPIESFQKTGLSEDTLPRLMHQGQLNFLKAGLEYADMISTVSRGYAKEISTDESFGNGLHETLFKRKNKIRGIINGIDTKIWNPEQDKKIPENYSIKTIGMKTENKKALADKFLFDYNDDVPVISMISRLSTGKGLDLLQAAFEDLMKLNCHMVLLGTGEKKYHEFFEDMMMKYQEKFSCYLGFDDELAHLIEAGSDMFLIPSRYEPCGLNQMYSLVYGTLPVVRSTGGLADTVEQFDSSTGSGNGFTFNDYSKDALLSAVTDAIELYGTNRDTWAKIMKTGMKSDFSWDESSQEYVELYESLIG